MAYFESFLKYLGVAMPLLYVVMGCVVLWRSENFLNLPRSYSLILGCTFILYGLYRSYRVFQRSFKNKDEDPR